MFYKTFAFWTIRCGDPMFYNTSKWFIQLIFLYWIPIVFQSLMVGYKQSKGGVLVEETGRWAGGDGLI